MKYTRSTGTSRKAAKTIKFVLDHMGRPIKSDSVKPKGRKHSHNTDTGAGAANRLARRRAANKFAAASRRVNRHV